MSDAAVSTEAAPASTGGFLAGEGQAAASTTTQTAATTQSTVAPGSIRFMSDAFHKDGEFIEGWSENLEKAGYSRLSKIGMKYKTETEFLKGLDHMAQFVGKKAGHLPPNESSTPEEIAEYRKQIGAPDEPTGYKMKPENLPPGSEWDDTVTTEAEALLHQHHVPAAVAPKLAELYGKAMQVQADKARAKFEEAMSNDSAAATDRFKKEWGVSYDERYQANKEFAAAHFGKEALANPVLQAALSMPGVVELVDIARRQIREEGLPGGDKTVSNSMSIKQQLDEYCAANPKWASTPHQLAHVTKLEEIQAQREKRGR